MNKITCSQIFYLKETKYIKKEVKILVHGNFYNKIIRFNYVAFKFYEINLNSSV